MLQTASCANERKGRVVEVFAGSLIYRLCGDWQWDLHSNAVFCSDVMFSLSREFEGTKGIIHPDDLTALKLRLVAAVKDQAYDFQFRIITTYGEVRELQGREIYLVDVEAENHTVTDLSFGELQLFEIKKTLEHYQLRREAYESADKMNSTGVWYFNAVTGAVWFSDNVFRIYGLAPQSLNVHLHMFAPFIHPDDRFLVMDAFDKAYQEQVPLDLQFRIISADGKEKTLHQTTQWTYTAKGEKIIKGVIKDDTEQKEAELNQQQLENELHFQRLVALMDEQVAAMGHWYLNPLTLKVVYSDSCFRLHGLKAKSTASGLDTFINFVHTDDRERVEAAYEKLRTEHNFPQIEYRIIRADGKIRNLRQQGKLVRHGEEMIVMGFVQDITAQRMAERKMEELKETASFQLAAITEIESMAGIGSWLWDLRTGKISWSKGLHQLLGDKSGELTQKQLQKLVYIEDRKRFDEELALVVQEKKDAEFEFRVMRLGVLRQVRASFKIISHDEKEFFLGMLQDVTTQYEMRRQLNERIQLNDLFTENILDRVLITDTNHTVILWNKSCEEVYKIKKEAAIGKNIFDVFPHLKNEDKIGLFNAALKGETIFRPRFKSFLRNEYYDLRLIPLKNEEGAVFGVMHMLHDVTREVLLQQSLAERLYFIESLVEASVNRIIVMDRNMNYLIWNKSCEEYYGIKKEEVIGKNILEVFPGSINDPGYTHFKRALRGETIYIPAQEDADGQYYEVYLIPIKNEREEVIAVLWILQDLTKEYVLTKEYKKAHAILDTLNEACFELNTDHKIVYINKSAAALSDKGKDELLNKTLWILFPKLIDSELYPAVQRVLEEGKAVQQEFLSPITNRWTYAIATPSDAGVILLLYDIQEIKEAREKLEQEHRRLKETQEIGHIGSFEWDRVSKTIFWSDELYRIFGLQPNSEEITMTRIRDLVHPDDRETVARVIFLSIQKPSQYELEFRVVGENGEVRFLNSVFESTADGQGLITKMRGIGQDVTERRQAEERVQESQNLLYETTLATPDAISIFDLKARQSILLNNCLAEWVGLDAEEMNRMGYEGRLELVHPDDRQRLEEFNESMRSAEGSAIRTIEYRLQTPRGLLWIRDRSKVFKRDKEGHPTHLLSVLQDLTKEMELRNQMLERSRYAETIIDSSIDRIMVYDADFNIIGWNKRSELGTGMSKEQMMGKNFFELFPRVTEDKVLTKAFRAAAAGNYTHVLARKGVYSPAFYEHFFISLKKEDGTTYAVLHTMHDVSHMVHQKEELRELNRILAQKNKELEEKSEEIGSFAFIASHDLREPLRKLHTFSDWLLQREGDRMSETGKNFIKKIALSVRRMDMLIEDVLTLAKIGSDRKREIKIDLNAVLERVVGNMKDYLREKGAELIVDVLPVISGNDNQIFYLFRNLISNAVKFQPPGNQPVVKIVFEQVEGSTEGYADPVPPGNYHKISFIDNGLGFEEHYFKKIFQVFQRLHNIEEYEGTGMGLAICRKIMENHNGYIRVKSQPGKGSVFCCYFPIV